MNKILIGLSFVCLLLNGCTTLPGTITERISGFDKSKEIVMEPAWVQNGMAADIKLGLYKTSKMDTEKAILTAVVLGAYNFTSKVSLEFNIDGEKITLESIDDITNIEMVAGEYNSVVNIPPANWSSKRYEIKKDLISRLISAKEVWVKVNLSRNYVEGKFSEDNPTAARPAFREFYKKAWSNKAKGDS